MKRPGINASVAWLGAGLIGIALAGDPIPARIRLPAGEIRAYQMVDTTLRLATAAGRVHLKLRNVRKLTLEQHEPPVYRIETTRGDTWIASLDDDRLRYYFLNRQREVCLRNFPFGELLVSQTSGDAWRPREHAKVFMRDGSRVFLDTRRATVRIANSAGKWSIPLGSVTSMTVSVNEGADAEAIASFPSGQTVSFRMVGSRLAAPDTFGNQLRIPFAECTGILGRFGIDDEPVTATADAQPSESPGVQTVSEAGIADWLVVPMTVWTVKGKFGPIALPTPLIREIVGGSSDALRVTTIYGEQLSGEVQPRGIRIPLPGPATDGVVFSPYRLRAIRYVQDPRPVPAGWWRWSLTDGTVLHARPDRDTIVIVSEETPGEELQLQLSGAVAMTRQDGHFIVRTREARALRANPLDRGIDLILLVNGAAIRMPWKLVTSVNATGTTILAPAAP